MHLAPLRPPPTAMNVTHIQLVPRSAYIGAGERGFGGPRVTWQRPNVHYGVVEKTGHGE